MHLEGQVSYVKLLSSLGALRHTKDIHVPDLVYILAILEHNRTLWSSSGNQDAGYIKTSCGRGAMPQTRLESTFCHPHDPHQTPFGLARPSTRMSPLRVPSAITPVVSENATCVMSSGRNRSEFLCMRSRAPLKTRLVGHTSLPRTPPSLRSHVEHARALNRHPAPS